jgi:predicted acylesterase/phospholipase RssA
VKLPLESRKKNSTRAATRPSDDAPDSDGIFVGIAISGGGSRSANYSAAMLFELQRAGILQKADYISSVSGGSLTAAYYCTHREEWNPKQAQKLLAHNFADDVWWKIWMPWNFFALMFTDTDRTDLLARSLDDELYEKKGGKSMTFADLLPERPKLLINSTDLQSGERFVFCNETFDELNSDLSKYPLAWAVAASSSVPVALHPVTLRDYSTIYPQYRHLIDGGITDNLGVRTLVDTYRHHIWAARLAGRPDPYPGGAIFLVIDARTRFDQHISEWSDIGLVESLKAGTGLTSTVLLERASAATMSDIVVENADGTVSTDDLRQMLRSMTRTGYLEIRDKYHHNVTVVHLALARVEDIRNTPFASFWSSVNHIATYFNISEDEAYSLYEAAELVVKERFQGHLNDIARILNSAATSRPSSSRPVNSITGPSSGED